MNTKSHRWSAIVRGAVLSQLPSEARVITNIAPKHYGVAARSLYDESTDHGEKQYWDNAEAVWRVDKMIWFIEKGDDLLRSRKIEFYFYRTFDHEPSGPDLLFVDELHESTMDQAPVYPKSGEHRPRFRHRSPSPFAK